MPESFRTEDSIPALKDSILENLAFVQARSPQYASRRDWFMATAYAVRDRILARAHSHISDVIDRGDRLVGYLSAEYLIGPLLRQNLLYLGIKSEVRQALRELGQDLDVLADSEEEPGLGNGGLGRLAACFMDSMATLGIPALGYGIRYEFGIFDQSIRDGWQVERTDKWLSGGNPWEILRTDLSCSVRLGGRSDLVRDPNGRLRAVWTPSQVVKGVAYDTPIPSMGGDSTGTLRLWKAEAEQSFDYDAFNTGDYAGAVERKVQSETISKVLYPRDDIAAGKRLRLEQEYFLAACSLHDMRRICRLMGHPVSRFHERFAVQLNDTHPVLGIAELMRLLLDEEGMEWEPAWEVTRNAFHFTNHTLLPEALERWPVELLGAVLPRHLQIIYEINSRFLNGIHVRFPGDDALVRNASLIQEDPRSVRMAQLACVGSRRINGVARLHTKLLKETALAPFYRVSPEKFVSVTNGVSVRRWLWAANPDLERLVTARIGPEWRLRAESQLSRLEPAAEDAVFREAWRAARRANKERLVRLINDRTRIAVDPRSFFDVQVKRIHEYKRQHLSILRVLALYARFKAGGAPSTPRTFIFAGKAAPGYYMAKLIIRLITATADLLEKDPAVRGLLRVVFIPDFNVKTAERVYPASDLSEQVSTAGMEASGTGQMKFALNGVPTIGTLDGANVELREKVGEDNFFLFGRTVEGLRALHSSGYHPREYLERDPVLREAVGLLTSPALTAGDPNLFRPIADSLLSTDPFYLLADFGSYLAAHDRVDAAFADVEAWTRISILNTARSGYFSSDRAILEYAENIWQVQPHIPESRPEPVAAGAEGVGKS